MEPRLDRRHDECSRQPLAADVADREWILGELARVDVEKRAVIVLHYYLDLPLREAREQFEKNYLEHQLRESGGSVGKLAKRVGMERTHLYRKLRSLGIDHKKGAE